MENEIDLDELEKEKADKYFRFAFEMFPDVEPGFLESKCVQYAFDQEGFNKFLEDIMLQNKFPKQQACSSQAPVKKQHNFSIESFVKKYPDPISYFQNSVFGSEYISHSISFLQDRFRFTSAYEIRKILRQNNFKLYLTFEELKRLRKSRKTPRHQNEISKGVGEPPSVFYDEVYFITNLEDIMNYLESKKQAREAAVAEARKNGKLLTCGCCFSNDLLSEDIVTCPKGHVFCRDCVRKSIEVLMGEGKIDFPCLEDCGVLFTLEVLQDVMEHSMHENILKKLQKREIAQANIPGLESCPFCDYSAIPDPAVRIFECLGCKKSSCRFCRKESHIPYTCNEVSDVNIKSRTYVEEKMTAALIRHCYRCGSSFVREDGCNKMTCPCGALMCYVCRKPISGYSHFSDNYEEIKAGKCPIWTDNNKLHTTEVSLEAEKAIEEIKRKNPECDSELLKKLKK